MLRIICATVISYFIGSIPTAYIFVRLLKRQDIRKLGSGNVGATNALRVLGKGWGITILFLDILKGFLPVWLLSGLFVRGLSFNQAQNILIAIGLGCIFGHNWTIFLNFKGGKGVATTLGVLLGLAFRISGLAHVLALTVFIWLIIFIIFRIISLASVIAALSFPIFAFFLRQSATVTALGILLSAFIILRHRSNIQRLLAKQEGRISFRK